MFSLQIAVVVPLLALFGFSLRTANGPAPQVAAPSLLTSPAVQAVQAEPAAPDLLARQKTPAPAHDGDGQPAAIAQPARGDTAPGAGDLVAATPLTLTYAFHLPVNFKDAMPVRADRMGFSTIARNVADYAAIRSLRAGWYLDWRVRVAPPRPGGIDYVQTVRLHQRLTCGTPEKPYGYGSDRERCPYVHPPAYDVYPPVETIQRAARANPGSIWLLGNEMDAMDWESDGPGGHQDEMTPQLYAVAYHDLYQTIREADPTARIAIGGVIQFTPLRQQYLEIILATYRDLYGAAMPIDVWNIHNFVGPEYCVRDKDDDDYDGRRRCYGMGIPPGIDLSHNDRGEQRGAYVGEDWRHTDMATFRAQIENLRRWMLRMGYGQTPLLISEYGVLYRSLCAQSDARAKQRCIDAYGTRYVDLENPNVVMGFMLDTFDYFATAADPAVSLVDGGRLVQQWAWFSLEDIGWNFNRHGTLIAPSTGQTTAAGRRFAEFATANSARLQAE